jgi:hypothetical protein
MITQPINPAAVLLLGIAAIVLLLLAGQLLRAAVYRSAGWRVRAIAFGGFCLLREGGKFTLKPGSVGSGRGALALSSVVPETPDIAAEEAFQAARKIIAKAFRLQAALGVSAAGQAAREGFFVAYYLYALLPLQENGARRRESNAFLREKLAQALLEIPPHKATRFALEAFDLLLMEHMADPALPPTPFVDQWLDHFVQDYQVLRKGKGEIHPVLFLHVMYALKQRRDDRWKVMESHVSTILKNLPGGRVQTYYRLQTLQMLYNEDHREALARRENIHNCGAWKLLSLFDGALDDEVKLNQTWK